MKLYLISQDVNNDYDTYDSAVVAADSVECAKCINPSGRASKACWCEPKDVKVALLGTAAPGIKTGIILASFNAG